MRQQHSAYYDRIRQLRSEGLTYKEISEKLDVSIPKSTLSYICKDVELPMSYQSKLRQLIRSNVQTQRPKAVEANKRIREARLEKLRQRVHSSPQRTDKNTLRIALAMLYLGEGSKWPSSRGLSLGSSDPLIVRMYIKLLMGCYDIPLDKMRCRVQGRADQDIDRLNRYWSLATNIPLNHFYKTKPDPRTSGRPTLNSDYHGVCVISCAGTIIQHELRFVAEELDSRI